MSKLTVVVAICLSLGSRFGYSQVPPILQTDKPKRGIYLNFEEFLNNSPSINSEFELIARSKNKQFMFGGSDYALSLKDTDPNRRKAKKFWGVSTGDSVYVNVSNYQVNKGYIKFQGLGRYCYIEGYTTPALEGQSGSAVAGAMMGGAIGGAAGGALSSIPRQAGFIMNINNGKFYKLHPDLMIKILTADNELLTAYTSERDKKKPVLMLSYIENYNKRHPEEIGKKEKLAKIILYRRDRKEKLDTVFIASNDSLVYTLGPGTLCPISTVDKTVTLCTTTGCKDFTLVFDALNYIECTYREGDPNIQLIPQKKEVGEFYVKEIQIVIDKRQDD